MNKGSKILSITCISVALFSFKATASIIDFELTPSGNPVVDNSPLGLNDGYFVDGVVVTFGFDRDGNGVAETEAIFERVGGSDPTQGFLNESLGIADTADPGYEAQLGEYFLRHDRDVTPLGVFIVNYNSSFAVTAASGEIWDIDGSPSNTEQYLVSAFDISNNLLDSIVSPLGSSTSGSSIPWVFSFSGLSDINKIEISFIGTKSNPGLAFNNFSPITSSNPIPEPTSLLLVGTGLGVLWLGTSRRKRK